MAARVNFYEEDINKLVIDRGHNCVWEQAVVCNCVSRDTGQPDFTCPTCGGSGYRYLQSKDIKAAVMSFNSKFEMANLQLREPGTAYVTPPADVIMGYKDRLRFPDFLCKFSEVVHWNQKEDGVGISPKTYRNIKKVEFLADSEYEYECGVDFEITEDGYHIRWLNKEYLSKLDGRNMSLLYYTTPSYLVDDLLHELRGTLSDRKVEGESFREFPKQYRIVREDFIYHVKTPEPVKPEDAKANWDEEGVTIG